MRLSVALTPSSTRIHGSPTSQIAQDEGHVIRRRRDLPRSQPGGFTPKVRQHVRPGHSTRGRAEHSKPPEDDTLRGSAQAYPRPNLKPGKQSPTRYRGAAL